jgi:beta-galactosidase
MKRTPFARGWETRPHASFFLEMVGAAAPWQQVTLPHDAALGRERDPAARSTTGYVPGGAYEYRTTLHAPEEYRDKRVLLEFEGVRPTGPGTITVTASAPGCERTSTTIRAR